jgi:hypothetical protein
VVGCCEHTNEHLGSINLERISWLAEQLSTPQGTCSVELGSYVYCDCYLVFCLCYMCVCVCHL